MTAPALDPTELTPAQWHEYLASARAALHKKPKDREALQAIRDANFALGVYDEAAAASPGERIGSGIREGAKGLGRAALDIPSGLLSTLLHPVQTAKNLPKVPGAIAEGLASGDQATVARTVGNIGSIALPFAKAGRTPAVVARAARAVTPPIVRSLAAKVTPPIVTDALRRLTTPRAAPSNRLPGLLGAGDDIGAAPVRAPLAPSAPTLTPVPGQPRGFLSPDVPTPPVRSVAGMAESQLQALLKMTPAEFEAAKSLLTPEVWQSIAKLRAGR